MQFKARKYQLFLHCSIYTLHTLPEKRPIQAVSGDGKTF
jgi:hypothetical protein